MRLLWVETSLAHLWFFNLWSLVQRLALNRYLIKCKKWAFPVNTLNPGQVEKYIQHGVVLHVHHIWDSKITKSSLKSADKSKDSHNKPEEENKSWGKRLQAPSPYSFLSKLADCDPGACEMTLDTILIRKANGPNTNVLRYFWDKEV